MHKEVYDVHSASYCYIGNIDGRILLITVGPENPFGYPGEANQVIREAA
jgi:hypothetical protein